MQQTSSIAGTSAPVLAPPPIKPTRTRRSRPKAAAPVAHLSKPSSIVSEVIARVLPLIQKDETMDFACKPGVGDADVRKALSSIIGDYTVEEAVSLYAMIRQKMKGAPADLNYGALYEAHMSLLDFISTGFGASVHCVAARVALFHEHFGDFGDRHVVSIRFALKVDLSHILGGKFSGDTFGSEWAHRLPTPKELDEDAEG